MLELITTRQFERDIKLCKKRGKDISKIWDIVDSLLKEEPLQEKHKPHKLSGTWAQFWECHINSDWLLIYQIDEGILYLLRTGTHSDLFS